MTAQLDSSGILYMLHHLRHLDWSRATPGLTQAEYLALTAVRIGQESNPDKPGVYVSALAEELTISVSMVSKLLKVLEEKSWIVRTVDRDSRRNTFVSLTPEGLEIHQRANLALGNIHKQVAEQMGREKYCRVINELGQLFACYEDALNHETG